jgi:membrane associated rhomboid family serine protease
MELVSALILVIIAISILLPLLFDGYATPCLAGAILAIFLIQFFSDGWEELALWASDWASDLIGHNFEVHQLITSIFLHGGIGHVIGNLLPLVLIGLPLEGRIGGRRMISIYLFSGLVGNLGFLAFHWGSPHWALGASGAIFGIVGSLAFLYPREKILAPLGFIMLPVPAMAAAVFFGFEQLFLIIAGSTGGIAIEAHIFGMVGGIAGAYLISKVWEVGGRGKERARYRFDTESIEPFLKGRREREIYETIRKEEGEIRDIWIEHLLPKLRCPECGKRPDIVKGKLVCRCGYKKMEERPR